MQQMVTHTLDCPNPGGKGSHQLAYYDWQGPLSKKTMVCVHGLTRNGRDFDALAQECVRDYRVLAPDIPGAAKANGSRIKAGIITAPMSPI